MEEIIVTSSTTLKYIHSQSNKITDEFIIKKLNLAYQNNDFWFFKILFSTFKFVIEVLRVRAILR